MKRKVVVSGLVLACLASACGDDGDTKLGGDAGDPPADGSGGDGAGDGAADGAADGDDDDAGADPDAGEPDGGSDPDGSSDPWADCPDSDVFVGPNEALHNLVATEAAVYCATFQDHYSDDHELMLKEGLAAKAMLRVTPGTYPLPGAALGSYRLPICIRTREAPEPELGGEAGEISYEAGEFEGVTTHRYTLKQPMRVGADSYRLDATFELKTPGPDADLTLDGSHALMEDQTADRADYWFCSDPENCFPALHFDSCDFVGAYDHLHEVTLNDGEVQLELRIGDSFASTEPGAFVRAHGTFRGVSFDQDDYWKLVYSPAHHHWVADFAVLFDAPIDGVCGLMIMGLDQFGDDTPNEAYAVGCALDRIAGEALTVEAHTFTKSGP